MQQRGFRTTGYLILVTGLVAAVLIYFIRTPSEPSSDELTENKLDVYQLERIGGPAAVTGVELNLWFASLWHGRRLAGTVALLSCGTSAACFWLDKRRT